MTYPLSDRELGTITGGRLDPKAPLRSRNRLLAACGSQIDAFTAARTDAAANPSDTRKQIDAITRGRSLVLCAENNGFEPPPQWRFNSNGGGGR